MDNRKHSEVAMILDVLRLLRPELADMCIDDLSHKYPAVASLWALERAAFINSDQDIGRHIKSPLNKSKSPLADFIRSHI